MSSSNCCFLTWIQIFQVWYSHFLKNFPQFVVIHRVKGFSVVNKAEVDAFLELSCFFDDPTDAGNLTSGSSAFFKSSLNIWKFMVHILLKPSLENFEHYFASMWDECNCVVVWTSFGIACLWYWNENWPFPVLWPLLSFLNLNYHTVALISHASKVMPKILQARLQQYLNHEFLVVQAGLRKGRGPEIKLSTSVGSWKEQESSRETSTFALLTTPKPLTVWITTNCGNFFKRWEFQTTWPAPWEICVQFKKQQLELENRLDANRERSTSRLCIVTLLI